MSKDAIKILTELRDKCARADELTCRASNRSDLAVATVLTAQAQIYGEIRRWAEEELAKRAKTQT